MAASADSVQESLGLSESRPSLTPLATLTSFQQAKMQEEKQILQDDGELKKFLSNVAYGRQYEAEAQLKENPNLAQSAGNITDHAGRTFEKITGLQYAFWALDWRMWTMILKYLPKDVAEAQAYAIYGSKDGEKCAWVEKHGCHFNGTDLIEGLLHWKININNRRVSLMVRGRFDSKQFKMLTILDWSDFGKKQFELPMNVLQEYCNPRYAFSPLSDFSTVDFMRTRVNEITLFQQDLNALDGLKNGKYAIIRKDGEIKEDASDIRYIFTNCEIPENRDDDIYWFGGDDAGDIDGKALYQLFSIRKKQLIDQCFNLGIKELYIYLGPNVMVKEEKTPKLKSS